MGFVHSRYEIVRRTQIEVFRDTGESASDLHAVVDALAPESIADYLGLEYLRPEQIPSTTPGYRTAGLLDVAQRRIYVSNEFPFDQQRLTGMHEVVHWLLHRDIIGGVMHRDRPIDPRVSGHGYDSYEWEATYIACLALMPEKLVKNYFSHAFNLPFGKPLELGDDAAFYLGTDVERLKAKNETETARLVAEASHFGRPIIPMCEFFKVSVTAMAIRLQELQLITPGRWKGRPNLRVVR